MQFDTNTPIWVQLVNEFERRIVTKEWPPGHRLPSVRDLAKEVQVNPNTVQKALAEMERNQLMFSQRTSGRFVTDDIQHITNIKHNLASTVVSEFVLQLQGLDMDLATATLLLTSHWEATTSDRPSPTNPGSTHHQDTIMQTTKAPGDSS